MKLTLIAFLIMALSACKVEKQNEGQNSSANKSSNQIAINTTNPNSEDAREFANEISERQRQNPDEMFEIVPEESKRSGSFILSHLNDDQLYPNKNFYIFIGLGTTAKDQNIQKTDWDAIYNIMNYLSKLNFRVLMNVQAKESHLRLAAQDKDTAVILWSSHGNTNHFRDFDNKAVSFDVLKVKGPNFYQFILSSCEGRIALDNYDYSGLRTWAWKGITNSIQLKNFLVSDDWSALDGKVMSKPVKGYTCSAKGSKKYSLMEVSSRKHLDEDYSTLGECEDKLQAIGRGICDGYTSIKECINQ